MNKLYWKAFGIYFSAMFLCLSLVLFPLLIVATMISGDEISVGNWMTAFVAVSLVFAWAWISALADSTDRNTSILQLQELAKDGWKMFLQINPVGWIILLWQKYFTQMRRNGG